MLANGKGLRREASHWGDGAHPPARLRAEALRRRARSPPAAHSLRRRARTAGRCPAGEPPFHHEAIKVTKGIRCRPPRLCHGLRASPVLFLCSIEPSGCTGFETSDGPHVQRDLPLKLDLGDAEARRERVTAAGGRTLTLGWIARSLCFPVCPRFVESERWTPCPAGLPAGRADESAPSRPLPRERVEHENSKFKGIVFCVSAESLSLDVRTRRSSHRHRPRRDAQLRPIHDVK